MVYNILIFILFIFKRSKSSSQSSTPPPPFTECQQLSNDEHEEGSEMFEEPVEEMVSVLFSYVNDVIAGPF